MLPALALLTLFQTSLADRIDKILEAPVSKSSLVGVCIVDSGGRTLYERNADLRMVPASNQKLLSISYALHTLGPDWRPKTRFWSLPDRIVVDCPGDPSMTYAKLKEIAAKLGGKPDTPIFVKQGYRAGVPPTWENDDLPHRYAPRITAFTVDRASFTLANDNGAPILKPEGYGVRIVHRPYGAQRNVFDPFGHLLIVYGELPKETRNLENFAIPEPDRAAASILGGRLFEATELPSSSPTLTVEGDPVSKMAGDCLKPSDNYLAECLMLLAASKESPLTSAYPGGAARMRRFLVETVGLAETDVRPYDGSGMSRHNFVTPRGIVKVLQWAEKQPWAELWNDSLAQPGKPGTLSTRLQNTGFVGKTGSLNSVSTLSGYAKSPSGTRLAVSIMVNHFIASAAEARALQDAIVREVEKPVTFTPIPVPVGALIEGRITHASHRALPRHSSPDDHRVCRPLHDGLAALTRTDRGDESTYAAAHRTRRVALRAR